jgi:LuxR family maltose regulon positive regulatory protein
MVPRSQVVELFEQGRRRKLTLVSAFAGLGKTTMLSSWLRDVQVRTVWLSLDSDDNRLRRFWLQVLTALDTMYPSMFEAARNLLLEIEPDARLRRSSSIEGILTVLINALASIEDEIALVLDDYDEIMNSSIHRSLAFILDHLPGNVHLFIITQHNPPLPLERWRTTNQLVEIHARDLSFSLQEAEHLLNTTMDLHLTPDEIAVLCEYSRGWVAHLHLAGLAMQGQSDRAGFVESLVNSFPPPSTDDLVDMFLKNQPLDIQRFLLYTSLLPCLNASLCQEMTRNSDSQAILARLEQVNPFIIALNDEHTWYRYHQRFSALLRTCMENSYAPEVVRKLHRQAARWYQSHNCYNEAMRQLLQVEYPYNVR